MTDIEDILGPEGPFARSLADFVTRRAQLSMASAVAEALEAREPLIAEAGTGTGKTFAYLVPALLAGLRVLVSTGTRTLQDQLFAKDVPLVTGALGAPITIALLKGRGNYLCIERLQREGAQHSFEGGDPLLRQLEGWSKITATGDLAEVPGFTESHPLWPRVTSTRDNCLGTRCSHYADCHVVAARREAQAADLVIVNHHLLLADLALKEDGFGDLLGSADAIILDEAHQLPDLATQFFGVQLSSRQVETILAEGRAAVLRAGGALSDLGEASRAVEAAVNALQHAIRVPSSPSTSLGNYARSGSVLRWEQILDLDSAAAVLADSLRDFAEALTSASIEPAVGQVAARALSFATALETLRLAAEEGARTVELTARGFLLALLPFDVSTRFRALIEARPASWIFTSATLSVGGDFSHFAKRLGIEDARTLSIASPFDYESQAMLYLPTKMPEPSSPDYVQAVIDVSIPLLESAGGGAFILFTSHRALAQGAQRLRAGWDGAALQPLLVQGEEPREKLLRAFREHGNAVLLGTTSFWEGVDVKGQALRLVIIEKLPFASPDDPLTQARIEYLQQQGANAFRDHQLPEAVLALKQGVGRLIRSEEDRGMIVICDPRLLTKGYGRVFRASLPEMPVTQDADEAQRFLRRISL